MGGVCRPTPGASAPSGNTTILRHSTERQVKSAAVGPVWEAVAVRLCFEAAKLPSSRCVLTVIRPASGAPIDATVTVVGLKRNCWQNSPFGPSALKPWSLHRPTIS
ncbi:MlrC C-terminal domain-containing protein [Bradyrhizobium sp. SEMIA]|uniref:MlrC C-terminal domain-containing protein n=1 Tax=Bradyrhizobium sp. SEMIA TaxID=2597515 RepID=UPI003A0FDCF3